MSKLPENLKNNFRIDTGGIFCGELGLYDIIIWENDKIKVPHFHIVDSKTQGKKFHCRMLIEKPKYYKGETSKLSQQDLIELCKHFDYCGYQGKKRFSNWNKLVTNWNQINKKKVSIKIRPEYEQLV